MSDSPYFINTGFVKSILAVNTNRVTAGSVQTTNLLTNTGVFTNIDTTNIDTTNSTSVNEYINGSLNVNGPSTLIGNLTVGNATTSKQTSLYGNVTVNTLNSNNSLNVSGNSNFLGNLTVGNSTIYGQSTIYGNVVVNTQSSNNSLIVNGNSSFLGNLTAGNSTVYGKSTLYGNVVINTQSNNNSLTVNGNSNFLGNLTTGSSSSYGLSTLYGNVVINTQSSNNSLIVNGNSNLYGNLTLNSQIINSQQIISTSTTLSNPLNSIYILTALVTITLPSITSNCEIKIIQHPPNGITNPISNSRIIPGTNDTIYYLASGAVTYSYKTAASTPNYIDLGTNAGARLVSYISGTNGNTWIATYF